MPSNIWTRRMLLQGLAAGTCLSPRLGLASEHDGYIDAQPVEQFFQNGVLLDSDGQIHNGIGIHLKNGRIASLSSSIQQGEDLKGTWIVPGFSDAGSTVGMFEVGLESRTHDHNESKVEERERLVPASSFNPLSATVPVARTAGFTHSFLRPSAGGLVVGQTSLVRLAGLVPADATVEEGVALVLAYKKGDKASSRMGLQVVLKDLLSEYGPTKPKRTGFFSKKTKDPYAGMEPVERIWSKVADQKMPLLISANRVDDIANVIALQEEFPARIILVGGAEAWMQADKLAAADVPVILGPLDVQPSSFSHLHARYDNAAILHKAGVKIAFQSRANHNVRFLPSLAGLVVAHGLPFEEAIRALTVNIYDILQIERAVDLKRDGTDLPASFFLCEGDPLQPRNAVLRMWIEGREVSLETRQTKLRDRFKVLSR
ncbi:MAG: hypothetical protein VX278_03200 [Myxococcota bacterium]|nr:hypothetical protein [Myxococcota bacterium]